MNSKKVIHYSSPEAAQLTKVEGWLSADGTFWPSSRADAEHMARYCGSTHRDCQECGALVEQRYIKCDSCQAKARAAKYASLQRKPWDGSSWVTEFDGYLYFSELSELADHCADNGIDPTELKLLHCKPNHARPLDPNGHFCYDLPEDGEVPDELAVAFEALNAVIRNLAPLSYSPGNIAVELTQEQIQIIKEWSIE